MRTRFVLPLLRTLAIVALVLALARPQSGGAYHDTREGIAIQMVLDVSGSMAAEDFIINGRRARRLDAVKQVFKDFVLGSGSLRGRENDLIGMTTFAMYADTNCPLTLDHGSLCDLLDETEIPGFVDGQQVRQHPEAEHTALGDAIALATDDLRRAGEQAIAGMPGAEAAKSRVMILLTDGADNPAEFSGQAPPKPIEAARVAATLGIKIHTIGAIGTAPSQRSPFGLFARPRFQVDEPTLKEIARITGGKYFRATDTDSLVEVYDEIDQLERRRTGERTFHDDIRGAKLAMLTGLGLLMLELLLVNTRYRRIP
jgi:Ca-activated chloride channel family protein